MRDDGLREVAAVLRDLAEDMAVRANHVIECTSPRNANKAASISAIALAFEDDPLGPDLIEIDRLARRVLALVGPHIRSRS